MKQKLSVNQHGHEEDASVFTLLLSAALTDLLLMNAKMNKRSPAEELIYCILVAFDAATDESITCLAASIP